MKLLIQRAKSATITIDKKEKRSMGKGLVVFLGIHKDDDESKIPWLVNKLLYLRIFQDENGKMNKSVLGIEGELLIVSQFTLYANCTNGRRPDFIQAATPEIAIPLYEKFIEETKKTLKNIITGEFGAYMEVDLINDGPVTIIIDEKNTIL